MTPRQRRLWAVVLVLIGMGIATALILTAFNKNLMYFYSPSQISAGEAPQEPARQGGEQPEDRALDDGHSGGGGEGSPSGGRRILRARGATTGRSPSRCCSSSAPS